MTPTFFTCCFSISYNLIFPPPPTPRLELISVSSGCLRDLSGKLYNSCLKVGYFWKHVWGGPRRWTMSQIVVLFKMKLLFVYFSLCFMGGGETGLWTKCATDLSIKLQSNTSLNVGSRQRTWPSLPGRQKSRHGILAYKMTAMDAMRSLAHITTDSNLNTLFHHP
jgi:hypothetical protein